ncbi:MAG: ATP-binding protein, partial [Chloroflexales bacterium]|nr:ATP-binding protein [Chloroflexales bacterium]
AGVPAVLGFQGDVAMGTMKVLLPTLISELRRDGQLDQALAAARATLGDKRPWWQAALWLRTDGRLWREKAPPDPRLATREHTLRALLHDHSGFIASRREAFVGRVAELAEIRQHIAEKLPTGGYVTITGQAGQGKSSVIAKLVADALEVAGADGTVLQERLQRPGAGVPICHFIPFSPGPDHQVGLLRNLIARLCLTYDLPDLYAASDSRPALRDDFAAALRDVAQQGKQGLLYIDGLDQIEEDASGVRDLSFLPEEPPAGIVFVLGTRPNDTLKPLELRKPQHEYWLPALSRTDFDLILAHRRVILSADLANRFYKAMQENALYLDLVARELAQADASEPEQIIARVADNPANLFSLSIERFQRNERQWEAVLRPILGLLLAARAPLSQRALRTLIGADDLRARQGLERLGGLIQRDGEGCYGLFHLKLGDFLRQSLAYPEDVYIFATDEEEGYHQQLADWCAGGKGGIATIWQDAPSDALEQERRMYARQHYIAHLSAARAYDRLWGVIDVGTYGAAKRRQDPSTRSYALDLDLSRQAVIDAAADDAAAQALALPRLWRYSLLRCILTSQADRYPEKLFLALVDIRRSDEAINLAELLSDPVEKAVTLRVIGAAVLAQGTGEGARVLQRARAAADAILDLKSRAAALSALAAAYVVAQHPDALVTFTAARAAIHAIPLAKDRAGALTTLAAALAAVQHLDAPVTFAAARAAAEALPDLKSRAAILHTLAGALVDAQYWDEARAAAEALPDLKSRADALSILAAGLATTQHPDAPATFTAARTIIDALPDLKSRADALILLAAALAYVQHASAAATFAAARAAAEAIPSDWMRADALCTLARALVDAQYWDEARAAAEALPDLKSRADALSILAAGLATTQHPD